MQNRAKIINLIRLLVLIGLAASAVIASIRYLGTQMSSWNPANLTDDPVTNWEARCAGLKRDLPTHGVVGYIADWDLPGWSGALSDMDNEFRLTQYALVPRILVREVSHAYVIGNFSSPDGAAAAEKKFGLTQIHSYGLGIFLFKNNSVQ